MLRRVILPAVTVIGREGATWEEPNVVSRLWQEANSRFGEIEALVKRDEQGHLTGIWGAMSDRSGSFAPWENDFTQGLYLAGAACEDDAQPPEGWTKWVLPASEYVCYPNMGADAFARGLALMQEEGLTLCGAAQDFTDPATGENYIYYPIRRL